MKKLENFITNRLALDNLLCVHSENESMGESFCREIIVQLIPNLPNKEDKILVISDNDFSSDNNYQKNRFLSDSEIDEETFDQRIIVEDHSNLGEYIIDYYKLIKFIILNNVKVIQFHIAAIRYDNFDEFQSFLKIHNIIGIIFYDFLVTYEQETPYDISIDSIDYQNQICYRFRLEYNTNSWIDVLRDLRPITYDFSCCFSYPTVENVICEVNNNNDENE